MEDEMDLDNQSEIYEPSTKSIKLNGSELYKLPDEEEISLLRDNHCLLQSNLFNLQVTELMKEVALPGSDRKKIDKFLGSIWKYISELPTAKKQSLSSCFTIFNDVKIPFFMKPNKVNGNMVFGPPANIQVIGSYQSKLELKRKLNVDIVLELPKDCMQEKDFLNQRYLRKRAVYLTYVAHYLKRSDLVSNVEFSFFMENPQKPVLLIAPKGKLSKLVCVRCHTCPTEDSLKYNRFEPSKSNVRVSWFTGIHEQDPVAQPTPHYNSLVLSDMLMTTLNQEIEDGVAHNNNFSDSIKLLKLWLDRRELNEGQGCFTGFLMTMLVLYLKKKRKVDSTMNCFQVVRAVLQYLGSSDWTTNGISWDDDKDLSEYHEHFEVVFLDPSGRHNLCFEVSSLVYKRVQHEAALSLSILHNPKIRNGFEMVFLQPIPFLTSVDHLLRIKRPGLLREFCKTLNLHNSLVEYNGNALLCLRSLLTSVLGRGLKSRVQLLSLSGCKYGTWDVTASAPLWKSPISYLTFGMLLNSETQSMIDKGPRADTPEAAAFRKFWGDKSDLRQFKDGDISEAVVWPCESKAQKRDLMEKICRHLLHLHCRVYNNVAEYTGNQLDKLLLTEKNSGVLGPKSSTGEESCFGLNLSYNELCKQLRQLQKSPLPVKSVQGLSAALRGTEVNPPLKISLLKRQGRKKLMTDAANCLFRDGTPRVIYPIEVICFLESSGKWPQDVDALQRMKAAFHIAFAEELEHSYKDLICVPSFSFVDIYKDGFVFRLSIAYSREVELFKSVTTTSGLLKKVTDEQCVQLEEKLVLIPKLANALNCISQKNDAFGLVCRIAKFWINEHMLSNHVPDIVTELLCAHLFVHPHPQSEPRSSMVAFHRFLQLLSTHDFAVNPVFVNFNDDLEEKDFVAVIQHFKDNRSSLPPIFISTPFDKMRSTLTSQRPAVVIVRRLKALASKTLEKLTDKMLNTDQMKSFQDCFTSSRSAYDVLIKLDPKFSLLRHKPQSRKDADVPALPVIGFNPAERYLLELEQSYGEVACFFLDSGRCDAIGVLWKPSVFNDEDFKIDKFSRRQCLNAKKAGRDVNAVLEDFRLLGQDLVIKIELHADNWKFE